MSSWILDFIYWMAFSCPSNTLITGISKPYPIPLFNLFPFTLQESFEFGSFKNSYTNLDILRGICLTIANVFYRRDIILMYRNISY